MSLKDFFKDQVSLLSFWMVMTGLTCLILWLTPSVNFNGPALLYLLLLQSLVMIAYLSYHYFHKKRWLASLKAKNKTEDLFKDPLTSAQTAEEKIIQTHLNALYDEQRETLEQLVQGQQEQRDFIDSWIHEIKVPLASIKLLNETIEDEIEERYYYQLENNTQKIEDYLEQVLYYARLDTFSRDYLLQEMSLKAIIRPLLRQNANYFIQQQLHYAVEGEDEEVLTDPKWLSFILNQILSNSLKYTPDNGQITLSITTNEEGTWLTISDNGIGIPLNEQRRVFDKGFTGETGRNLSHHATGIGLFLAKELAEKLGHRLVLQSVPGEGTDVSILFPALGYFTDGREERLI